MLIVMKPGRHRSSVEEVLSVIRGLGFKPHPMPGATRTADRINRQPGAIDPGHFEMLSGVAEAIRVSKAYQARRTRPEARRHYRPRRRHRDRWARAGNHRRTLRS